MEGITQILYECKSSSEDTVVYVFGTHHFLPKATSMFDLVLLDSLIQISDIVFSESFVDDGDSLYTYSAAVLTRQLRYENNSSLADKLTKQQYAQVLEFYKRNFKVREKEFRKQSKYVPLVMHRRLKYDSQKYFFPDRLLLGIARKEKKRIKNLENVQTLQNMYESLSSIYNTEWLMRVVNCEDAQQLDDDLILEAYLRQDTSAIADVLRQPNHWRLSQTRLVDDRNMIWLKVIEKNLRQRNFIYCGLAHVLIGDFSLLNFFKIRRYSIKAIPINIAK